MGVIRNRLGADAVTVQQHPRGARVFAGHQVCRCQCFQRTQANITQIANGRGDKIEPRLQGPRCHHHIADFITIGLAHAVFALFALGTSLALGRLHQAIEI